jgi:hypothetical protein
MCSYIFLLGKLWYEVAFNNVFLLRIQIVIIILLFSVFLTETKCYYIKLKAIRFTINMNNCCTYSCNCKKEIMKYISCLP